MSRPLIPKVWNTEYTCSMCHYRAPVRFADPESFDEDEPVGGRDKWTQKEALREAQERMEKRGRRAMQRVRCPGCQKRAAEGVRGAYLWAALPLVGAAPATFMIAIIISSQLWPGRTSMRGPGLGATLVMLVVSALIVLRGQRNLLVQAQNALHFGEKTPSA